MLEVLPIQDKKEQEAFCARCGIPYRPDDLAYKALAEGELVGVSQFTLTDEAGVIHDFAPIPGTTDREAMFVLGRGTLNFIDLCGIHRALFDAPLDDDPLIRQIGFRKNDKGHYEMDLTDFFKHPCQHENRE